MMRSSIDSRESIPITVRQLEALARISESLARMDDHVHEAIKLFRVSTFDAANSGIAQPDKAVTEEQRREIEWYVERRCLIGS